MKTIPPELPSWDQTPDPETAARDLREQLAHAKARMQEHREQMHAAGLTKNQDVEGPKA